MTDLSIQRPPDVRFGRPVRRFVVAEIVLALTFGGLWWSGAVTPRLSRGDKLGGSYDMVTGRGTAQLELRNRSLLGVEVRGATMDHGRVTVASVRIDGHDVASGGQTIAGGDTAPIALEYACPPKAFDRAPGPATTWIGVQLEITAKAPIGPERSRIAGTITVPAACIGSQGPAA